MTSFETGPHARRYAPRDFSERTELERTRAKRRSRVIKAILADPTMYPMTNRLVAEFGIDGHALTGIKASLSDLLPEMRRSRSDLQMDDRKVTSHVLTDAERRAVRERRYRTPGPGDRIDAFCRVTGWREDRPALMTAPPVVAAAAPQPPQDAPEPVAKASAPAQLELLTIEALCASWDEIGRLLDTLDAIAVPVRVEVVISGPVSLRFEVDESSLSSEGA
jgi:hypothetical protein